MMVPMMMTVLVRTRQFVLASTLAMSQEERQESKYQ